VAHADIQPGNNNTARKHFMIIHPKISDSALPPSAFSKRLVIGALLINLFVIALVGLALRQSRLQYEQRAAVSTENLSHVLEQYIAGAVDKIDLALFAVADEVARQRAGGVINTKAMNAYISRIFTRLPFLNAMRMANVKGEIVYGADKEATTAKRITSVADRDYFIRLRNDPAAGLVISKPVLARITGKRVIIFARRLNKPDGSFDGAIWAAIELGHFNETFAQLDVGRNGVVSFRDSEMALIARHPVLKGTDDSVGQRKVSQELLEQVKAGMTSGTYYTPTGSDNIARTVSFRKISSYPLFIIVGLATGEYLVQWKKEVVKMSGLTALFALITGMSSWLLYRDSTKRRLAEVAVRKSEALLNEAQHVAHMGSWELNIVSNVLVWSDEVFRIFEIDREKFGATYEAFLDTIHPDDRAIVDAAYTNSVKDKMPYDITHRLLMSDGRVKYVHNTGETFYDKSGRPIRSIGTAQDITERKKAEEALRESESLLRESQRIAGLGSYILDIPTGLFKTSDVLDKLLGIDETYERSLDGWLALVHPDDLTMIVDYLKEVIGQRRPFDKEYRIIRHNDKVERWVYGTGKLEFDEQGRSLKLHGTIQDITDRKKLEEQLRQSQKLEAIGTLAGGIAHDFNNLLQGVFGYISIAKLNATNNDKSIAALEQAEKALHMSVNLTTQLLTFSKGGKPIKKKIALQSVVENSVRFALSGSSADYLIKLDADLLNVEADEGQIGQVIQNIVLNADQAMPVGGTIVIAAKNVQSVKTGFSELPQEGKYVEISIKDNGAGISEEYLSKIFDPYFTTKAKGSGLGLATCYSIIKNHGGVIHVSSKMGKGTTFYVYLPAVEAGKEEPKPPKLSPFVRNGKILVMDDDELIRNIAGDMIKTLGHEVELAEHGEAAIEKYKAYMESGKPFDIVILDLTVRGGIGGLETIERLVAVDPGIKAIVSSGYSDDAVVSDYRNYGFSARLTKPYNLQELSDTLNNLLRPHN
jgi:PAS domain S-box-containing protein